METCAFCFFDAICFFVCLLQLLTTVTNFISRNFSFFGKQWIHKCHLFFLAKLTRSKSGRNQSTSECYMNKFVRFSFHFQIVCCAHHHHQHQHHLSIFYYFKRKISIRAFHQQENILTKSTIKMKIPNYFFFLSLKFAVQIKRNQKKKKKLNDRIL